MSVEDWVIVCVTSAAIGTTAFVLIYLLFAPWYRSTFGWALMLGEIALAALLDLALYVHWSHAVLRPWVILSLYGFIAVTGPMRAAVAAHMQIAKRRRASS